MALGDVGVGTTRLADKGRTRVDLILEAVPGGVAARGEVSARWSSECRRCLAQVEGSVVITVEEVGREGGGDADDAYELGPDVFDLEPVVRDALLLELPLAPVCESACRGPSPERYHVVLPTDEVEKPLDQRWAALDGLEFDSDL